jgi:hypothetical protein
MLRDAEATIRDLREKLGAANQNLHGVRAELVAERLAGQEADDGLIVVPEAMVPTTRENELPVVRRPVGRPGKIVAVQPVQTKTTPSEKLLAIGSPNIDVAGAIVRRPVGRPRKIVVEPIQTSAKQSRTPQAFGRAVTNQAEQPKQKVGNRGADDQEPIQWWVQGWRGR